MLVGSSRHCSNDSPHHRHPPVAATRLQLLTSLGLHYSHWAMNSADPPHAQRTRQLVFPFLSKLMYLSQTKTSQSITLHKIEYFSVVCGRLTT